MKYVILLLFVILMGCNKTKPIKKYDPFRTSGVADSNDNGEAFRYAVKKTLHLTEYDSTSRVIPLGVLVGRDSIYITYQPRKQWTTYLFVKRSAIHWLNDSTAIITEK